MRGRTKFFIAMVASAAALFVAIHEPVSVLSAFSKAEWSDVLAFAFVGLLSQAAAIDFGRDRQSASSMAFIPFLTSAILLPPVGSILVATGVVGLSELFLTKRPPLKAAFNVAQ